MTISHHAPKESALAGDEGFEGGWFVDHGWLVGPGIPERLSYPLGWNLERENGR